MAAPPHHRFSVNHVLPCCDPLLPQEVQGLVSWSNEIHTELNRFYNLQSVRKRTLVLHFPPLFPCFSLSLLCLYPLPFTPRTPSPFIIIIEPHPILLHMPELNSQPPLMLPSFLLS